MRDASPEMFSRNVASLNMLVHDVINLRYYEHWQTRENVLQILERIASFWIGDKKIYKSIRFNLKGDLYHTYIYIYSKKDNIYIWIPMPIFPNYHF